MAGVEEKGHKWKNGDTFRGRMIVDPDLGDDGDVPLAGVFKTKATGDTYNGTFNIALRLIADGRGAPVV